VYLQYTVYCIRVGQLRYDAAALCRHIGIGCTVKPIRRYDQKVAILQAMVKCGKSTGILQNADAEYKTKSLDGTKPNTNHNTNPVKLFYAFSRITTKYPSKIFRIPHYTTAHFTDNR